MKKYEVEFYEDETGNCPMADWLRNLNKIDSKENKSMLKKVYFQIERLEYEGISVGEPIVKKLDANIWELRPIPNRILFGIIKGRKIVLIHHFRKKSRKTPKNEIEKANREYANWLRRGENK